MRRDSFRNLGRRGQTVYVFMLGLGMVALMAANTFLLLEYFELYHGKASLEKQAEKIADSAKSGSPSEEPASAPAKKAVPPETKAKPKTKPKTAAKPAAKPK